MIDPRFAFDSSRFPRLPRREGPVARCRAVDAGHGSRATATWSSVAVDFTARVAAALAMLLWSPGAATADPATAPPLESPATPERPVLTGTSTLAEWKAASGPERSHLAVELSRKRLGPGAEDLAVATAAMEITGCLTATARDPRFQAWTVAPTAATCLSAPELPGD